MATKKIYFDHNASTPLDSRVRQEMHNYLQDDLGNPASRHHFGRRARTKIDHARDSVAQMVGCEDSEIFFTSGGTEGNNWIVKTMWQRLGGPGKEVVSSAVEHPSVLESLKWIEHQGGRVKWVGVDSQGQIDPQDLEKSISDNTVLATFMAVNNETGVIFPTFELAEIAQKRGIFFHVDAVQAAGKIPLSSFIPRVHALTLSGHKIYGPKGIGAVYLSKTVEACPYISGGAQELGRRAGTENVLGIVGMGKACEIANSEMMIDSEAILELKQKFEERLLSSLEGISVNSRETKRVPNTSNICFQNLDGETILLHLDLAGIAVSTGAACASGKSEPSHVLLAMGQSAETASSSIRFSFGKLNTMREVNDVAEYLIELIPNLRRGELG
jgi:cysteine desulfurase